MWEARLVPALRSRAHVALQNADRALTGDDLWERAHRWAGWLRDGGVSPGDRVLCALPSDADFVSCLLASLLHGVTFAPIAAGADVEAERAVVDARVVVTRCEADGGPPRGPMDLRDPAHPPSTAVRFLLQTSGSSGARRWIALSDGNVASVLDSHAPLVDRRGATVLSVLPWHHAFGLVIQLLPALLAGATLVREPSAGRDVDAILAAAKRHAATHLDAVPHTVHRLAAHPAGRAWLAALGGGVVGGAPVDAPLAALLARTRLRVGYGQTEAAPGIALGDPGEWSAGLLGRPVGCTVRVDDDGVLAFRGENACVGTWDADGLAALPPDRWVRTGDLARVAADGTLHFDGRMADTFKLANGRFAAAAAIERAILAAFPQLDEALLSSPDGAALLLAVSMDAHRYVPLTADAVRPLLGGLSTRPLRIVTIAAAQWVRTPKGELDRRHPTGRASVDAEDGLV